MAVAIDAGRIRRQKNLHSPWYPAWRSPSSAAVSSIAPNRIARGRFEIAGLPVGECTPHVIPPDGTYVHDPSPVTIKDFRGCAGVAVVLAFDGHIRGRVVDASLQPLAGVTIDAVATGERVPSLPGHAFCDG